MTFQVPRDRTEELGNVYHYWVGAKEAAQAAASQANKARDEYQKQLLALMVELGIDIDQIAEVKVQWHTGQVSVGEAPVLVGAPSDGVTRP